MTELMRTLGRCGLALARIVNEVHMRSWGRSRALSNLVGQMKRIRVLRRWVRAALYRDRPQSDDGREHYCDFPASVVLRYEEEMDLLERMLGRDLQGWRAPLGARASEGAVRWGSVRAAGR